MRARVVMVPISKFAKLHLSSKQVPPMLGCASVVARLTAAIDLGRYEVWNRAQYGGAQLLLLLDTGSATDPTLDESASFDIPRTSLSRNSTFTR